MPQHFLKEECRQRCAQYSYWWTYRAKLAQQEFKIDQCVVKCVYDVQKDIETKPLTISRKSSHDILT